MSELLETEKSRTNAPEAIAVHKFYAPLLLDGQVYAVKLTVKEFDEATGNRIYSVEGIDVNEESDLSEKPEKKENPNSSTTVQRSDSINKFIEKLRDVNSLISKLAQKRLYEEAIELVAEEARNSERRLEMSDEERKEKRPSLTNDIEPTSQILLEGDDFETCSEPL